MNGDRKIFIETRFAGQSSNYNNEDEIREKNRHEVGVVFFDEIVEDDRRETGFLQKKDIKILTSMICLNIFFTKKNNRKQQ